MDEENKISPEEVLSKFESGLKSVLSHYKDELKKIRSNRVTASVLEELEVQVYGQRMRLKNLGHISSEGARTLRVEVWDKSVLNAVLDEISKSGIGASPQIAGEVLKVVFPELTSERKAQMVKFAKKLAEDTKAKFRDLRNKALKTLSSLRKSGLSEDREAFFKREIDKVMKLYEEEVDELLSSKISDIES